MHARFQLLEQKEAQESQYYVWYRAGGFEVLKPGRGTVRTSI